MHTKVKFYRFYSDSPLTHYSEDHETFVLNFKVNADELVKEKREKGLILMMELRCVQNDIKMHESRTWLLMHLTH